MTATAILKVPEHQLGIDAHDVIPKPLKIPIPPSIGASAARLSE